MLNVSNCSKKKPLTHVKNPNPIAYWPTTDAGNLNTSTGLDQAHFGEAGQSSVRCSWVLLLL